jgi:hypothetical protein
MVCGEFAPLMPGAVLAVHEECWAPVVEYGVTDVGPLGFGGYRSPPPNQTGAMRRPAGTVPQRLIRHAIGGELPEHQPARTTESQASRPFVYHK